MTVTNTTDAQRLVTTLISTTIIPTIHAEIQDKPELPSHKDKIILILCSMILLAVFSTAGLMKLVMGFLKRRQARQQDEHSVSGSETVIVKVLYSSL